MEVLFEDAFLLAVVKPAGIPSAPAPGTKGSDMLSLLEKELEGAKEQLFLIHRLDCPVGGVMVFAKTKAAAAELNRQIASGAFRKTYLAVTDGIPEERAGEYRDLLFKDSKANRSYVVKSARKGVREAVLRYRVEAECAGHALVRVALETGRTHQIRVQFSSRKTPLTGDGKYGSREKVPIALWSAQIRLLHPASGEEKSFCAMPDNTVSPWNLFRGD